MYFSKTRRALFSALSICLLSITPAHGLSPFMELSSSSSNSDLSEATSASDSEVCCAPPGEKCSFCDENPEACKDKKTLMLIVPGMGNSEQSSSGEFVLRDGAPEKDLIEKLEGNPCLKVEALPFNEDQSEARVHEELTKKLNKVLKESGLSSDSAGSKTNGVVTVGYSQGGIAALPLVEQLEALQASSGLNMQFHTFGTPFNLNYGTVGPWLASAVGQIGQYTASVVASGKYYKPNLNGSIPHTQHVHLKKSSGIGVEEQRTDRLSWDPQHVNYRTADHRSILSYAELLVPRQCECEESACLEAEEAKLEAFGKLFSR